MEGRNDIHWWGDKFREAAGKTRDAILNQAKVVADAISEEISTRDYAKEIGKSKSAVDQYAQIGKDARLSTISGHLPDAMKAIYQCTQLTDEQLAKVTSDMTEAAVKALRVEKKEADKGTGYSGWTEIGFETGALNPTDRRQNQKVRKQIEEMNPGIDLKQVRHDKNVAQLVAASCLEIVESKGKADEEYGGELKAQLSMTAQQKLDAAIRAHQRVLDMEFEEKLQARVRAELEVLLPTYRKDNEEHIRVINAYRGVFTRPEYKLLLGVLHSDRYPNVDQVQSARLDKVFDMVKSRELELCGVEKPRESTLPKTVHDLMARRKKK